MSQGMDEEDLGRAFGALRQSTEGAVPPFRAPAPRRTGRRLAWHERPLAALGLIVLAAAGLMVQRRVAARRALLQPFLTTTQWQSPTDYLLQTPGHELLSAVPSLGGATADSTVNDSRDTTIHDSTNGG